MENEERIAALVAQATEPGIRYNTKLYLGVLIANLITPQVGAARRAAKLVGVDRNNLSFLRSAESRDPVTFQRLLNHEMTLGQALRAHEAKVRAQRSVSTIDKIAELSEEGLTTQAIAERLGISVLRVRYLARNEGMSLREDQRPKVDSDKVLSGLLLSLSNLAMDIDMINVEKLSYGSVEEWLRELNKSLTPFRRLRQQLRSKYENGEG